MAWSIAACSTGGQVFLGREQTLQSPDAGPDGSTVVTTPLMPPTLERPMHLVEVAKPGRCDSGEFDTELSVELSITHTGDDCPPPLCGGGVTQMVPLEDHSVWAVWQLDGHSRLEHVSADGTVLGSTMLPTDVTELTVDDHGVAWLVTPPWRPDQRLLTTLRRFDASVNELDAPSIYNVAAIAAVPGHGVVVASHGGRSVATLVDFEGRRVWSRQGIRDQTGSALVGVGKSTISLLYGVAREPAYEGVAVTDFDFDGSIVAERESTINIALSGFPYFIRSAVAFDSDLVLGLAPPDPSGGERFDLPGLTDVESIDASGSSRWALRLPTLTRTLAVAPDGAVWVGQFENAVQGPPPLGTLRKNRIARISHDGRTCRLFSYDANLPLRSLAATSDGTLWFSAQDRFGRFASVAP